MKEKFKAFNLKVLYALVAISSLLAIATIIVCLQELDYYDFLYLYNYLAMIVFLILIAISFKKEKYELLKIAFASFLTGCFLLRTDNFIGAIINLSNGTLNDSVKNTITVIGILTFAFFIFPYINYYIMHVFTKDKISSPKENTILLGIDILLCIIALATNIIVKDIYIFTEDRIIAILTFINMIVMLLIFIYVENFIFAFNVSDGKTKLVSSANTTKSNVRKKTKKLKK